MTDMTIDIFAQQPYGKAALKRFGEVEAGFRLYQAEWLSGVDRSIMKVTGALFREAKKGKFKGKLSVMVKGTTKLVFVTGDEIKAFELQENK